jgi:hypothetical protein
MRIITVVNRQSILDIAIQEYGSVEGVFNLLADDKTINESISYTDQAGFQVKENLGLMSNLFGGQKIRINSEPVDLPIYNFFQKRNLKPVTDFNYSNEQLIPRIPDHNSFDYNPLDYH